MASTLNSSRISSWAPSITISLHSYGHANGPFVRPGQDPDSFLSSYNIRHLPNPPRNLRAMTTGLSPRLQKEFLKNDLVESFLERVQNEIIHSLETLCVALPQNKGRSFGTKDDIGDSAIADTSTYQKPNISLLVTVCCEEGHHRSVAFVEELARRLSSLRDCHGLSDPWKLSITISHRDLDVLGVSADLTTTPQVGKSWTKTRQRGGGKDARRLKQKNKNGHGDELSC